MGLCINVDFSSCIITLKEALEIMYYIAGIIAVFFAMKQYKQYKKEYNENIIGKPYGYATILGNALCFVIENIGKSPIEIKNIAFDKFEICGKTKCDIVTKYGKPYVLMPNQKIIFNSLKNSTAYGETHIIGTIYYNTCNKDMEQRLDVNICCNDNLNTDEYACWDATAYSVDACTHEISNTLKRIEEKLN